MDESKQKHGCRNRPWRFAFGTMAVWGGIGLLWEIAMGVYVWLIRRAVILPGQAATIGVIGGADGPKAIFVTVSPDWRGWAVCILLLAAGIWGWLVLRRKGKE